MENVNNKIEEKVDIHFGQELRALFDRYGLKPASVATSLGLDRSTIYKWLNSPKEPPLINIVGMSTILGIPLSEFPIKYGLLTPSHLLDNLNKPLEIVDEFVYIRKARTKLSGGAGNFVSPEDFYPERYAFRSDWISTIASSPDNVMLMEVEGTSMEPLLEHGDVVMVDRGQNEVKDGLIYAIAERFTTEEWLLRVKILYDKKDTWQVKSLNSPTGGPMVEEYPKEDVWVIGRVVWLARELVKGKGL